MSLNSYSKVEDHIRERRKEFENYREEEFKEKRYYYVIMDIYNIGGTINTFVHEECEIGLTKSEVYADVNAKKSIFDRIRKNKNKSKIEEKPRSFNIYAVKTEEGIFEMVTGKRLSIYGEDNSLACMGLIPIDGDEKFVKLANNLKFLEVNPAYKKAYIEKLGELSGKALSLSVDYDEKIQNRINTQTEAVQYLKAYKLPNEKR